MAAFNFADRYAEASLSPSGDIIKMRQAPAERIIGEASVESVIDLVGLYYASPGLDLAWFRDEFADEDPSFSLINNERECRVLAAAMLDALIGSGNEVAILGVQCGSVAGQRVPPEATWLVARAKQAHSERAVAARAPREVTTRITHSVTPKLGDEIAAISTNDWATLVATIAKVRNESVASAKNVATQTASAVAALLAQVKQLTEENQVLWWLHGEHSGKLGRHFSTMSPATAAVAAAIDLSELTTVTPLGPIAVPAMMERAIKLARDAGADADADVQLTQAFDELSAEDLHLIELVDDEVPPRLKPLSTALNLARNFGSGAWQARFDESTGLSSTLSFKPIDIANQLYLERLLGRAA